MSYPILARRKGVGVVIRVRVDARGVCMSKTTELALAGSRAGGRPRHRRGPDHGVRPTAQGAPGAVEP